MSRDEQFEAAWLAGTFTQACGSAPADSVQRERIKAGAKAIWDAALQAALAEQPAAPVLTDEEIIAIRKKTRATNCDPWGDTLALGRALLAAAIPPGCVVVKDEPVARMLTWRGPSHTPTPPRAARTYAEFPEDNALPANKDAYWENAEPLYAARPGEKA